MRLWHDDLLPHLPRQQLMGQHRECAALRGNGWGKKHSVVDYVFLHSPSKLYAYHVRVMDEMKRRGYKPDEAWYDQCYRGKLCAPWTAADLDGYHTARDGAHPIYQEHNDAYLLECLDNLFGKGIALYDRFALIN